MLLFVSQPRSLLFLYSYSYEEYFMYGLIKKNEKKLAGSIDDIFRYSELEIKDITDSARSASFLVLHLEIGSEDR